MAESTLLRSVPKVVDELGGTFAVARLLRRTPQAVSHWKTRNILPDWTFPFVTAELSMRGKRAPRKLWRRIGAF